MSRKVLIQGATLLTLTSLVVKVLSAVYRVPFQNIVGNEGFYIYQQVYPLYGIALTLAMTGIPLYISKLIAAEEDKRYLDEVYTMLCGLSVIGFIMLCFGATWIARAMGNIQLTPLIQVASILFLLTPWLAMGRGYHQGRMQLEPVAYAQLAEQSLRVLGILVFSAVLMHFHRSLYQIGTLAMASSVIGGVGALLILWWTYQTMPHYTIIVPRKGSCRRFYQEGLILAFFVSLLILFQLVDSFVIGNQLMNSGFSASESQYIKGVYDRGQPLLQFGLVIVTVIVQTFLPPLTAYASKRQHHRYQLKQQTLFKSLFLIGGFISIGLAILMPEFNWALFGRSEGNVALSVLMFAIWLMAILQYNQVSAQSQNISTGFGMTLIIALSFKAISDIMLVPVCGIIGGSLSTLLGLLSGLLVWRTKIKIHVKMKWCLKALVVLGLYTLPLGLTQCVLHQFVNGRMQALIGALIGVVVNASIGIGLVVKYKLLTVREWLQLPMGAIIMRIVRKLS